MAAPGQGASGSSGALVKGERRRTPVEQPTSVRAAAGVPEAAPVDSVVGRRCTPWTMALSGLPARRSQEAAALAGAAG
eukprot:11180577-Alexandrium_andersonii.AAC.1